MGIITRIVDFIDQHLSWFKVLGITTAVLALAASWLVTLEIQSSFHHFKVVVYNRCLVRSVYDQNQFNINQAVRGYYRDLGENITHNTHDNAFYKQLESQVQVVLVRLDTYIEKGIPPRDGCTSYKP